MPTSNQIPLFITVAELEGVENAPIQTSSLDLIAQFSARKAPQDLQDALLIAVQAGLTDQVEFYVKEKNVDVNADYYADIKPQKLLYLAWRNREKDPQMYAHLKKLGAKMSEQELLDTGDLEFTQQYRTQSKTFLPPKSSGPTHS